VRRDIWLTFPDGTEHELHDELTIGRDPSNNLRLDSPKVSREHSVIRFERGRWFIDDCGSFNGTFLNGVRVQPGSPLPLRHADRISIGPDVILFSWPAQADDPETTEPN
jgi:pSer/pThr/pTyr-binding forkhead associated (FHA) protein